MHWTPTKASGARRTHHYEREEFAKDVATSDRFWVAEVDGRIIGCLILRRIDLHPTTGDITQIYVDLPYRGRGVGNALVETMKAHAQEQALRGIFWEAQTDNYDAIHFALHHGFAFAGFNLAHYRNDDAARQRDADFRGVAIFLYWPAGPAR